MYPRQRRVLAEVRDPLPAGTLAPKQTFRFAEARNRFARRNQEGYWAAGCTQVGPNCNSTPQMVVRLRGPGENKRGDVVMPRC